MRRMTGKPVALDLYGAAAHEENRFAKYVSVSQQSIQKDYFSPRLMIDFSGLRIVGAGAGGFADPYPDRVGPSKPYPGSFGMLEQGGGSGKTVIVGGIEVCGEGVKDVVVEGLTMQQVGFYVNEGASATIRNCEVSVPSRWSLSEWKRLANACRKLPHS